MVVGVKANSEVEGEISISGVSTALSCAPLFIFSRRTKFARYWMHNYAVVLIGIIKVRDELTEVDDRDPFWKRDVAMQNVTQSVMGYAQQLSAR